MPQHLTTVLLSLGTSLIVSIFTFVLGLKSGKNQVDRAKLQEQYKQLYFHFSSLKDALIAENPKQWTDYEVINNQSMPFVRKMEYSGDILFLDKKISLKSLDLEKDALFYSWELKQHAIELHRELASNTALFTDGYKEDNENTVTKSKYCFSTYNPNECSTAFTGNYLILYSKKKTSALLKNICANRGVILTIDSPNDLTFKIYQEGLNASIDEFIEQIFMNFHENIEQFDKLIDKRLELISEIDLLMKMIEKRVKEPVGFWETVGGAFSDMFR